MQPLTSRANSDSVRDPLVTGRATDDIQIMRAFSMAQLVSIAAKSVHADSPVDTSNEQEIDRMKTVNNVLSKFCTHRLNFAALIMVFAALLAGSPTYASDRGNFAAPRQVVGTWYVALDAGPFDPNLAGLNLSGLAHFHSDRTFILSDAGDFGAQSFLPTVATPQYGAWDVSGWRGRPDAWVISGTSLFLEGDKETGEVFGWSKVQYVIKVIDRNHLVGTISAFFLPCDNSPPVPSPLSCPDPVANASAFMPASPPDVPVTFTRIVAGE